MLQWWHVRFSKRIVRLRAPSENRRELCDVFCCDLCREHGRINCVKVVCTQ